MKVILTVDEIDNLIEQQAADLAWELIDNDARRITVFPVMSGAMFYAPKLIEALRRHMAELESRELTPLPEFFITKSLAELGSRHVLIIDTIFDTGRTARGLLAYLSVMTPKSLGPLDVTFAFLIRKERLPLDYGLTASCPGIVPEVYVFGFGLDDSSGERRELPYIATEDPKYYG